MQTEKSADGLIVNQGTMDRRVFVQFLHSMKHLQPYITHKHVTYSPAHGAGFGLGSVPCSL